MPREGGAFRGAVATGRSTANRGWRTERRGSVSLSDGCVVMENIPILSGFRSSPGEGNARACVVPDAWAWTWAARGEPIPWFRPRQSTAIAPAIGALRECPVVSLFNKYGRFQGASAPGTGFPPFLRDWIRGEYRRWHTPLPTGARPSES